MVLFCAQKMKAWRSSESGVGCPVAGVRCPLALMAPMDSSSLPSPRPQSSTWVFMLLLLLMVLLLSPAWHTAAQRCPQTCVCDNSRRHVTCRHQNLTEVPNTIPEVRRGKILTWVGSVARREGWQELGLHQWFYHCLAGSCFLSLGMYV